MSVFRLRQLLSADEASWLQFFNDTGSLTWTDNIPILDAIFEMPHERIQDAAAQSRIAKRGMSHIGAHNPGTLTFRVYNSGHLSTAAGSLTETWLQRLMGDGLRGNNVAEVGTTISGTSSAVARLDVADSSTYPVGGICRVGVKGDGRGDGQAVAVASITNGAPDTIVLLTDTPAACTTNGDVVYGVQMSYFDEDAAQITKRFAMLHAGTGEQWVAFGCELASIKLTFPFGQSPEIEFVYKVADYKRVAITFPNATALGDNYCAPVAGGSFFINDVATTTRATINPSSVELNISLGLEATPGSGTGEYGYVTGWVRTGFNATVTVKIPWQTSFETWWDTANGSLTAKHCLFTASATNGRAVGFRCPRLLPMGQRPNLPEAVNGQTYTTVMFECDEGTTTNDLIRAAVTLFNG